MPFKRESKSSTLFQNFWIRTGLIWGNQNDKHVLSKKPLYGCGGLPRLRSGHFFDFHSAYWTLSMLVQSMQFTLPKFWEKFELWVDHIESISFMRRIGSANTAKENRENQGGRMLPMGKNNWLDVSMLQCMTPTQNQKCASTLSHWEKYTKCSKTGTE